VWVEERHGGRTRGRGLSVEAPLEEVPSVPTCAGSMWLREAVGREEEKHLRQMDDHGLMP